MSVGQNRGIRKWQVSDGREVWGSLEGDSTVYAIALSRDHKWMVSGAEQGASVWDAKTHNKVVQVGTTVVLTLDFSPDSTKFATGTGSREATPDPCSLNIWDVTTGERLVGPLEHDGKVVGVKFSPNGNHIATVTQKHHIRIFDSRNGDQLIVIDNPIPEWSAITPIVWPFDGRLFAVSGGKIKSFDTSTGSQLAEWQIHSHDSGKVMSLALSANNRFIASFAGHSVSFWDTSTHTQLGSVLKDVDQIRCIALSPDGTHLATGGYRKPISIWNLSDILPESYLAIKVSTTFPMLGVLITFIHQSTFLYTVDLLEPRM